MKATVHTPVERAYCPVCGEDVGPMQDGDAKLWCRNHGWITPIGDDEDETPTLRPPD